jgi:hypothetical protein
MEDLPQIAIESIKVLDHTLSWSRNFILFVVIVHSFEAILRNHLKSAILSRKPYLAIKP